jgi:3-hydroxybutyryl-CoA dehydratase
MNIKDFSVGMSFTYKRTVSRCDIESFAKLTGDTNPVHLDEEYARESMFKAPIAHGMLIAGYVSKVFGSDFPGPGCIYISQNIKFTKPVYVNDRLVVYVEIVSIDCDKRRLKFKTECSTRRGIVLGGEAELLIPQAN